MCGNGDCGHLSHMVFGPGDNTTMFVRWQEDFQRDAERFMRHEQYIPPFTPPVTERMPDPCECCGKIHAPKKKTLGERLHVQP